MAPVSPSAESYSAGAREEVRETQGIPGGIPEGGKAEEEVQFRKTMEQLSILEKYQIIKIIK